MTEEEGKGKKRQKRAGNQAGNRPSAEEEEKEENMQTGSANEAGKKRGRPRKQLSEEEMKKKEKEEKKKKHERDRDYRKKIKAFLEMPGIKDMFQLYNEELKKTLADSLKGMAEQGSKLTEDLERLDERSMGAFINKCQELFQKFFKEEGIIEKFKAIWYKLKEYRQCKEKMDDLRQVLENPEMLEGNLKAGSSNIGSSSINANPKSEEGKKEIDDLKKQVEELQEKVSKVQAELAKRDEINSKDVFKQDLAAVSPGSNSMKLLLESTDAGTKFPSLSPSDSMDADTDFPCLPPLDSVNGSNEFRLPSLDSMDADPVFQWAPPLGQSDKVLTSIGQGHTNIDDSFFCSSDPPTVVPDPFVSAEFTQSFNVGELIDCSPPRDFTDRLVRWTYSGH